VAAEGVTAYMADKLNKKTKEDNFMLYIPKRKHESFEVKKDIVKLIFYHDKLIERFVRWLVKKPLVSDMELDKVGSKVWLLIDGESSVFDIGQRLINEFGKSCEPAYDRLIMYLRYLNKKGWICFERGNQK
jgi:hypothetical protein